ncbi:hypothetical protein IAU59_006480 [Kwoniella sp. CBS 9459]
MMTNLFQLEPLALESIGEPMDTQKHKDTTSTLDAVTAPRFFLPELDEHISGNERLLASLRGSSSYRLQDLPPLDLGTSSPSSSTRRVITPSLVSEKRKGKEVEFGEKITLLQTADLWAQITDEDGPGHSSHKQTFERVKTWDVVDTSRFDPSGKTPFLSEKPVFLFDALLTSNEPSIQLPKLSRTSPTPVHDPKALLELMIRATLGTTTTEHLKWDKRKAAYTWASAGGRPMGLEGVTAVSAFKLFLDIGTAIRRLETIIDDQSVLPLTPTHHALFHAVSTCVTFIKQRLTSAVQECIDENNAGWNKWIAATKDVRDLTGALCDVMGWPLTGSSALALPSRASSLLSHLYAHLLAALSTSCASSPAQGTSSTTTALAYLLSNSSGPFFNLLHAWIGLADSSIQDDDLDPMSQPWADLGITRKLLTVSEGGWEYYFSSRRMPVFISREDARTLFEAGRSLRLLREASGGAHPLCATDWSIGVKWSWGSEDTHSHTGWIRSHVRRVKQEVEYWRRATKDRTKPLSGSTSFGKLRNLHGHRKERKRIPMDLFHSPSEKDTEPVETSIDGRTTSHTQEKELERLFALFNKPPGYHLDSPLAEDKKAHLWAPTPLEALHAFMSRYSRGPLLPPTSPTLPLYISQHLLSPLLAHSTLISTSLVSLYLDDLRLLDHLDILHSFWLGGDVDFIERVSAALFGREAGAGEALGLGRRARTRARLGLGHDEEDDNNGKMGGLPEGEWGIGLGLGLSERAKWPPGGSALAYALRTTLLDDKLQEQAASRGSVWEEVEDRVSFAIKQLPEDDTSGRRAKWMDPQGEALDFLYLSYSPPPTIAVLLPRSLIEKYQSINNLLLRLARCEVVLKSMYWPILHHTDVAANEALRKTGVDSRLSRASSKAKASLQRSREKQFAALFPEQSAAEKRTRVLRMRMAHFVAAFGRYVVDTAIGIKWATMRRRLEKLKKKAPVREEQSRPSSPSMNSEADYGDDDDDHVTHYDEIGAQSDNDDDDDDEEGDRSNPVNLNQLQSIHSLVAYHNITLDKILRASLLGSSAGQQVTSKIMARLLGLVLDLGKVLVEVERGARGWQDGAEMVKDIEREWNEKERVFLHALDRLSLRTSTSREDVVASEEGGADTDLQMLISGEGGDRIEKGAAGVGTGAGARKGGNDLQELLLRLRLGATATDSIKIQSGGRHTSNDGV